MRTGVREFPQGTRVFSPSTRCRIYDCNLLLQPHSNLFLATRGGAYMGERSRAGMRRLPTKARNPLDHRRTLPAGDGLDDAAAGSAALHVEAGCFSVLWPVRCVRFTGKPLRRHPSTLSRNRSAIRSPCLVIPKAKLDRLALKGYLFLSVPCSSHIGFLAIKVTNE